MGMVGGQVVDIESQGKSVDFPVLEYIHIHKTGSLILSSIRAGALISSAGEKELIALTKCGEALGLAFQIADDILDVEGVSEKMGKNKGSDKAKDKATYPALLGLDESKKRAEELMSIALAAIDFLGNEAAPLRQIAKYIINRQS
jgi:geranylgeranyl diphosphate synthase type II